MRQHTEEVRTIGDRQAAVRLGSWVDSDECRARLGGRHACPRPVGVILVWPKAWKARLFENELVVEVVDVVLVVAAQAVEDLVRLSHLGENVLAIYIIPEVLQLIRSHVSQGAGRTPAQQDEVWNGLGPEGSPARTVQLLKDVAAWLVINSMRSEKVQYNLLCEQTVSNVWRKGAFRHLLTYRDKIGDSSPEGQALPATFQGHSSTHSPTHPLPS